MHLTFKTNCKHHVRLPTIAQNQIASSSKQFDKSPVQGIMGASFQYCLIDAPTIGLHLLLQKFW
jgi:hypothetical protein